MIMRLVLVSFNIVRNWVWQSIHWRAGLTLYELKAILLSKRRAELQPTKSKVQLAFPGPCTIRWPDQYVTLAGWKISTSPLYLECLCRCYLLRTLRWEDRICKGGWSPGTGCTLPGVERWSGCRSVGSKLWDASPRLSTFYAWNQIYKFIFITTVDFQRKNDGPYNWKHNAKRQPHQFRMPRLENEIPHGKARRSPPWLCQRNKTQFGRMDGSTSVPH